MLLVTPSACVCVCTHTYKFIHEKMFPLPSLIPCYLCPAMASHWWTPSGLWLISPAILDGWEAHCCWSNRHFATLRIFCVLLLWPRTGSTVSWNICLPKACSCIASPYLLYCLNKESKLVFKLNFSHICCKSWGFHNIEDSSHSVLGCVTTQCHNLEHCDLTLVIFVSYMKMLRVKELK
jgi:hypothetical protein